MNTITNDYAKSELLKELNNAPALSDNEELYEYIGNNFLSKVIYSYNTDIEPLKELLTSLDMAWICLIDPTSADGEDVLIF